MSPITVFHDGKIVAESETWMISGSLPVGAYIRDNRSNGQASWCRVMEFPRTQGNTIIVINERDIPNWIKAWLLILN